MLRTLALLVVGYAAYRVGREFIASVPSDFDPVPAPSATPKRRRKPAAKPTAKAAAATTH